VCDHENTKIDYLISQKPKKQGCQSVMSLFTILVPDQLVQERQHFSSDIIIREKVDYFNLG
jgi:hypothetical protein